MDAQNRLIGDPNPVPHAPQRCVDLCDVARHGGLVKIPAGRHLVLECGDMPLDPRADAPAQRTRAKKPPRWFWRPGQGSRDDMWRPEGKARPSPRSTTAAEANCVLTADACVCTTRRAPESPASAGAACATASVSPQTDTTTASPTTKAARPSLLRTAPCCVAILPRVSYVRASVLLEKPCVQGFLDDDTAAGRSGRRRRHSGRRNRVPRDGDEWASPRKDPLHKRIVRNTRPTHRHRAAPRHRAQRKQPVLSLRIDQHFVPHTPHLPRVTR